MRRGPSAFNRVSVAAGLAFLYLPIVLLVVYSFNASRLVTVWGGFSTRWYGPLPRDDQLLDAYGGTTRALGGRRFRGCSPGPAKSSTPPSTARRPGTCCRTSSTTCS